MEEQSHNQTEHYDVVVAIVTHLAPVSNVVNAIASATSSAANVLIYVVDTCSGADYTDALRTAITDQAELLEMPQNDGFGAAVNHILFVAPPSDYFLILNADAKLGDEVLDGMKGYLDTEKDIGLIAPKIVDEAGETLPLNKRAPTMVDLISRRFLPTYVQMIPPIAKRIEHYMMQDVGYDHSYPLEYATHCCMMFRRDVLVRVGGFDVAFQRYLGDADITLRTAALAKVMYVHHLHVVYRSYGKSRESMLSFVWMLRSMWLYFKKWGLRVW